MRPRFSSVLIGVGAAVLAVGAYLTLAPWYEAAQWRGSPEALRAQRNADVPPPIWVTPAPTQMDGAALPDGRPIPGQPAAARAPATTPQPALAARPTLAAAVGPATIVPEPTIEQPTPTLGPSDLQLAAAGFAFLDPPEPGARARLTVSIHNPTGQPSGPISLALPQLWLQGYRLDSADPLPLDGGLTGAQVDETLRLTFDGPAAESDIDLSVGVVTTDEVIDAPLLTVLDAQGREVGHAQPTTEAPPPRPGPIYSIDIPHLKLHTGVLPVDWEPPLFVVGQLRDSAFVTEGNSVLVGHVRGAPGYNIFDHLDQLTLGDTITASSRGETYDFVVSQMHILPEDDVSPTVATSSPRLTLMTCAGEWNPLTRDYSDRLWVVAEPPDIAAVTIAVQRAPTPQPVAPIVPVQVSAPGGLGNTDSNLAATWRAPVGESAGGLAVYHPSHTGSASIAEYRAQLADMPLGPRRALVVAQILPPAAPLAFDAAVGASRPLMPEDAQPRDAGPEGNPRFAVERFTSPSLASMLPPEWFADRHGQPGDFVVVYARRPDGRIPLIVVGIGDDVDGLLSHFTDVPVDH